MRPVRPSSSHLPSFCHSHSPSYDSSQCHSEDFWVSPNYTQDAHFVNAKWRRDPETAANTDGSGLKTWNGNLTPLVAGNTCVPDLADRLITAKWARGWLSKWVDGLPGYVSRGSLIYLWARINTKADHERQTDKTQNKKHAKRKCAGLHDGFSMALDAFQQMIFCK